MSCLSLSLYDTHGLAPRMNMLFWGSGDFQESYSNKDTSQNAWNRIQEVLWSKWESYWAICRFPRITVKWHFDLWPVTETSQSIRLSTNFMTLILRLSFSKLRVVSIEHLQRVWHTSRERLPFQTLYFVPLLGTCLCSNYWDQFSQLCRDFSRFSSVHVRFEIACI